MKKIRRLLNMLLIAIMAICMFGFVVPAEAGCLGGIFAKVGGRLRHPFNGNGLGFRQGRNAGYSRNNTGACAGAACEAPEAPVAVQAAPSGRITLGKDGKPLVMPSAPPEPLYVDRAGNIIPRSSLPPNTPPPTPNPR